MINIILDKKLDEETFLNFFDLKIGGVNFSAKIKTEHPKIDKKNYKKYINDYYKEYRVDLDNSLSSIKKLVQKHETVFFEEIEKIFKYNFSQKEYFGALSIFDCNPRYLDKNIFQAYYKRDSLGKLEIVFHEVLHFVFFDYCDTQYKDLVCELDSNSGPYWDLSEIFNVIILNQPSFQNILKRPELIFYPNHKEIYPTIEKIWRNSGGDMRKFIKESLNILSE